MVNPKHVDKILQTAKFSRREFLFLSGISVLFATLPACKAGQTVGEKPLAIRYATGGATPPTEIQIAIFSEFLQKEVLQHYGNEYTVNITTTKGTPEAQTLLVAEQADFATLAFSTIATTVAKDAVPGGISIVAGLFVDGEPGYGGNTYLVLEESGIQTAEDLRGKTLGVNALGTAVDIILRVYLRNNGIDPNTDVKFAEVGFGAMGAALREGRIDLGSFVHPFMDLEEQKGGVRTLFSAAEVLGPNSAVATVARNKFLEEHPEAVRAFLDDWVRGLDWLIDENNREKAIEIMSDISKTPPETLGLYYGKPGVDYYRNPLACPSAQALQVGVDAMVSEGFLDQKISIAPLVDTSYLPKPCP
ncbi:MAG: ABC transporter substrate-binding protein [Ardenticatenaceae bacterium]|nr:ABC transporter substrate-binding protein [Ardenticatenaceae bacterium]